jgi:hypothetical protein
VLLNLGLLGVICLLMVWIIWRELKKQQHEDSFDLIELDDPAGQEILTPHHLSAAEKALGHVVVVTDAPAMALDEAKEKAKAIVLARGFDEKLLHIFAKVKHYGFFVRHNDGEQRWNIGVQNISAESKETDIGHYKVKMDFVTFFIDKDMISIGFASHRVAQPDRYKVYEVIQYLFNNKLIMTLEYENDIAEMNMGHRDHSHYHFTEVEEFHHDHTALDMIDQLALMIERHNQRQAERHVERHDENYRGKFSFRH